MELELRDLRRRFGRVEALRGVSCRIEAGRRVAVVGPNGSGKSTLNRCVLGLLRFEGEIRLGGRSVGEDPVAVARRVAYVPQIAPNLAAPAGELVRAVARVRGRDVASVARVAARLDLSLGEVEHRPFRGLSGGMKQKLLIALAFASGADLLVLDEPTGSLDAHSRARFFELFSELAGGATVLLCSHRLEEVRQLVDQVLVLSDGRLVHDAPVSDFLEGVALSVVEVRVAGPEAEAWLRARGFRPASGSWWVRVGPHAEKARLLEEVLARLGGAVQDLNARDVEALDLPPADGGARG